LDVNSGPIHQEQFELLAMPHAHALLRVATRLTGDRARAEDAVQDTLLLAWRSFHQFDIHTNCKAWLFRIMLNVLYKGQRQVRARPREIPLKDSFVASPDGAVPESLRRSEILSALDSLTEDYRTVLLLAIVEGFTCKEIAAMLNIPIGTVMSRLSRARAVLRDLLSPADARRAVHNVDRDCASKGIQ
jgi:RNA polymerase sigma-70 factor (ECF subfamily)